ncbi:hypothetical protein G9272_44055 [Streptomyces asoensis]|uniref:Uncharacterized protein n=1 Tax=Streptomyces asoensis TaxID=249586 RepID=A0A6M4X2I7_9ACTN|nr:hypothetical protein [Streptomyces asoensis]QJT06412.1 hypothetical protein G9272_44055 [Streptomyces asoensis]
MRREDTPGTAAASGLSTDDLARPRDRSTQEGAPGPQADVPTFPGESTATPSKPAEEEPVEAAAAGTPAQTTGQDAQGEDDVPQLLTTEDEEGFRTRWQEVQDRFVDDPRDAVHTADALVADVMQRLAATFADHKQELEGQWNRGEQADTEDLRQALRHYRSFFNRLLVT